MMRAMANRQRLLTIGTRRGERFCSEFGQTIRDARVGLGLAQQELGPFVRMSSSQVGRAERAMPPYVDFIEASKLAQVLGLELSVKCFATGAAVRDAGHVRLLNRLISKTPLIDWRLERPIPIPGDQRAWDARAVVDGSVIGLAAETRLHDVQALLRREHGKMRDSDVELLLLLVLGSRANRETLRDIRESLRPDLPLDSREILAALRQGKAPSASGIVLL
jgi:transcriptional regulator with XRE-family HTH domain